MGKLYIMVRPKNGKTSEERFNEQFEDCVRDTLYFSITNITSNQPVLSDFIYLIVVR